MNLLVVFAGGLCLITGIYGLVEQGYAPICTGAVIWGSLIVGYQIGVDS